MERVVPMIYLFGYLLTIPLIAFGSLDFLAGQLVSKWLVVLPAVAVTWLWRHRG